MTDPQGITSLSSALDRIRREEALLLPDIICRLDETSWTPNSALVVPSLGVVNVNQWARDQLSQILGFQFDRWFSAATQEQQADEMNRRLGRAKSKVRLRVSQSSEGPVLRAVVTPSYSAMEDSVLLTAVGDALSDTKSLVQRLDITQRMTCCVIRFGDPEFVDARIGDVSGSITVMNSGVGWCKLGVMFSILRLMCTNGMRAPVYEASILSARHRFLDPERVSVHLEAHIRGLPAMLKEALRVLGDSTNWPVANVEAETRELLREVGMIRAHLNGALAAYRREPLPTVFGVSQALTLRAQQATPEERHVLESLAGKYVLRSAP